MAREIHLSSMLVHARPERLRDVTERIEAMGCEVHAANPEGKIIVTHEAESTRVLGDTLTELQLMDGVLAATMVFHHCEPAEEDAAGSAHDDTEREASP